MYKVIRMDLSDVIAEIELYKRKNEIGNDGLFPSNERHIQAIMDYYDDLDDGCVVYGAVYHPDLFRGWYHATCFNDAIEKVGINEKEFIPVPMSVGFKNNGENWAWYAPRYTKAIKEAIKKYCHYIPCSDGFLYKVKPIVACSREENK